eukprot:950494-Rhodomonas_salina.2
MALTSVVPLPGGPPVREVQLGAGGAVQGRRQGCQAAAAGAGQDEGRGPVISLITGICHVSFRKYSTCGKTRLAEGFILQSHRMSVLKSRS